MKISEYDMKSIEPLCTTLGDILVKRGYTLSDTNIDLGTNHFAFGKGGDVLLHYDVDHDPRHFGIWLPTRRGSLNEQVVGALVATGFPLEITLYGNSALEKHLQDAARIFDIRSFYGISLPPEPRA